MLRNKNESIKKMCFTKNLLTCPRSIDTKSVNDANRPNIKIDLPKIFAISYEFQNSFKKLDHFSVVIMFQNLIEKI